MSRNSEVLTEFVAYCVANPEQRFWQALRNWSGQAFIFAGEFPDKYGLQDTFSWEGKEK